MSFEDELRNTMRDHDHEAPKADSLPPSRWRRSPRRTWWPALAAAAVVVLAAAIALAVHNSGGHRALAADTSSAPNEPSATNTVDATCPQRYRVDSNTPWVPQHAVGIDAGSRLVPDEVPTSAFVCGYLNGSAELSGTRPITANLGGLRDTLTWQPHGPNFPACTADLQQNDHDAYLIHLTYPSGAMWVSAPGDHCEGASNGTFSSPANLKLSVVPAYENGAWPTLPTGAGGPACGVQSSGRFGDETALVPGQPDELIACNGPTRRQSTTRSAATIDRIAHALNELPTKPTTGQCGPSPDTFYDLVFLYDRGPAVIVWLSPGCKPEVANGSLQSESAASIVPLVEQLLGS